MASAKPIRRVLVANRGEIAVRVIRACKALGIETVVVVSEADRESRAAKLADRSVCIGPARATESYLHIDRVVQTGLLTRCDAVHPGYGFLSEREAFAERCTEHGLTFIGPRADTILLMGNKLEARRFAGECGVPLLPGSQRVESVDHARTLAEHVGYPVLLKAAAGGGGKGMKIVQGPSQLGTAFETGRAEAQAAFGDPTMYMEHYIVNARHVEVQVLGDRFGNVIHLGERDCSAQRRFQKIIEEARAPAIADTLRAAICESAVMLAARAGYENAGTVEFVVDQDAGRHYFLEMNTRIQVEHPVTEMITGVDLVQEQIRVAAGAPLSIAQKDVTFAGHAIEVRVNAEAPEANFRPSPGLITEWREAAGEGVRVDTHCFAGYRVPPFYDSLLAKLVVWGETRAQSLERLQRALASFVVRGVDTTIPFLQTLVSRPEFAAGGINTRWAESLLAASGRTR